MGFGFDSGSELALILAGEKFNGDIFTSKVAVVNGITGAEIRASFSGGFEFDPSVNSIGENLFHLAYIDTEDANGVERPTDRCAQHTLTETRR